MKNGHVDQAEECYQQAERQKDAIIYCYTNL